MNLCPPPPPRLPIIKVSEWHTWVLSELAGNNRLLVLINRSTPRDEPLESDEGGGTKNNSCTRQRDLEKQKFLHRVHAKQKYLIIANQWWGWEKLCKQNILPPPITILSVCLSSYDRMHAGSWKNRLNGCLFCLFVCLFFRGRGWKFWSVEEFFPTIKQGRYFYS